MQEREHSASTLAEGSGIGVFNLRRAIRGAGRLSEANVRVLASFLGDDPDWAASLAGYVAVTARSAAQEPFRAWLRAEVERDGRSLHALGRAARVHEAIGGALRRGCTLSERTVRALARFFDADEHEIAALAGYPDRRIPAPDPRGFATFGEWLAAALLARNESATHASIGAALSENVIGKILGGRGQRGFVERPVIDKLAAYFLVDVDALHALRVKNPARIAASKKTAARLGVDQMRAAAAKGRAALERSPMTLEQRRSAGRRAGFATSRVIGAEGWRAIQARGVATKKARGRWFTSVETRAAFAAKMRANGRKGFTAGVARYGLPHMTRGLRAAERNGAWFRCVFCQDPSDLIYRTPSQQRRAATTGKCYHRSCLVEWLRTTPERERMRQIGKLGELWRRINQYGDDALRRNVRERMRLFVDHTRRPNRFGRPPSVLRDLEQAVEMTLLQHDGGMSAAEVAALAGLLAQRPDENGKPQANSTAMELFRLGRAYLGYDRIKPGPRLAG